MRCDRFGRVGVLGGRNGVSNRLGMTTIRIAIRRGGVGGGVRGIRGVTVDRRGQ